MFDQTVWGKMIYTDQLAPGFELDYFEGTDEFC
jgi:hypothetical protein